MKNLKYIFFLIFILPLLYQLSNYRGVWLKEGERKGKAYKFGGQKMTDNLLELAKTYSERDTEKLFSYYSEEFLTEKEKSGQKTIWSPWNLSVWFLIKSSL